LPETGEITISGAVVDGYLATLESIRRETKTILTEHWLAVKRVAKALFERDHLDQADVDRLIAG